MKYSVNGVREGPEPIVVNDVLKEKLADVVTSLLEKNRVHHVTIFKEVEM